MIAAIRAGAAVAVKAGERVDGFDPTIDYEKEPLEVLGRKSVREVEMSLHVF
jgi:hypothetical protein